MRLPWELLAPKRKADACYDDTPESISAAAI